MFGNGYFIGADGESLRIDHGNCCICGAVIAIRSSPMSTVEITILKEVETRIVTDDEAALYLLTPGQQICGYFCANEGLPHVQLRQPNK